MLTNKKVYVGKHSKEIQEKAFALGIKWITGSTEVRNLDSPFLYFDDNNYMSCGKDIIVFNTHRFEEITAEEILEMEIPVDKTIHIGTPGWYSTLRGDVVNTTYKKGDKFKLFNTKEEAEAYAILPTLLYWRDKYNDGWKPDWKNDKQWKYSFNHYKGNIEKGSYFTMQRLFIFKTPEIRDKFMEDFKEELEIVKPLL